MRTVENPQLGGKRVTSIAGILGMIRLRLDKYLIIITKVEPVGRIRGHTIYKIKATEFLPLQERDLHDSDEDAYMALLKTHLRTGPMYFSYSFDLTNSFQRQTSVNHSLPLWQRADDRFFWNRYIQSDLIDARSSYPQIDPYILPVQFGYVNISATVLKSTPLKFVLITRKSRHRAGTRYLSRGIDEAGHVGNFNETEQIILIGDTDGTSGGYDQKTIGAGSSEKVQVLSYVQTRGSVPVNWAELNNLHYTPKLQIRGVESATDATRLHFDEQISLYGDNYLVNLVNQKGREERVKAAYEQSVRLLVSSPAESKVASDKTSERFREIEPTERGQKMDRIHYIYFDFHHECRGMQWHRALLLLDKLGDGLHNQGFFQSTEGGATSTVQSYQQSVVRSNCMDCLDRTNVVQSMLARWTLEKQMIQLGVLATHEDISNFKNFELTFRNGTFPLGTLDPEPSLTPRSLGRQRRRRFPRLLRHRCPQNRLHAHRRPHQGRRPRRPLQLHHPLLPQQLRGRPAPGRLRPLPRHLPPHPLQHPPHLRRPPPHPRPIRPLHPHRRPLL